MRNFVFRMILNSVETTQMYLDELKNGETAIIEEICDTNICIKLIEMGCLPGEKVLVRMAAPYRDPIAIEVAGNLISLRKSEARTIRVKHIDE
jgi:ferrous iron transport protein A